MRYILAVLAGLMMAGTVIAAQPTFVWMGPGFYVNPAGHNPTLFLTPPPGHLGWTFSAPYVPPVNPPVVTPPSTPPSSVAPPVQQAPAEQPKAKAKGGRGDVSGKYAMAFVAIYFMFVICERENIEICKAPDWMRGPLDDRFDQARYGTQ